LFYTFIFFLHKFHDKGCGHRHEDSTVQTVRSRKIAGIAAESGPLHGTLQTQRMYMRNGKSRRREEYMRQTRTYLDSIEVNSDRASMAAPEECVAVFCSIKKLD